MEIEFSESEPAHQARLYILQPLDKPPTGECYRVCRTVLTADQARMVEGHYLSVTNMGELLGHNRVVEPTG